MSDKAVRERSVQSMIRRQRHRGPDAEGILSREEATLGMCRLAIIDLAHGHQPMVSPTGRFTLVFNGAIYNHRQLRTELAWDFRTDSDTEVLLAAYVRYGRNCLRKLRGMFAFAVWDAQERVLFAARDPLGIKPFYYATSTDCLVFASELNGLLASRHVRAEIDPVSVSEYLAWLSVPAPRTIYRQIYQLQPGHCLAWCPDRPLDIQQWWRLPVRNTAAEIRDRTEFIRALRYQLDGTIRSHLVADVPIGAFLSGGLDSTAIVGLAAQHGARKLKTFSLVFDETGYSEHESARLAAKTFGTDHHEERITGSRVADDLPRILNTFDQPTGDGINTYYASRLACESGVKVVLSGLGGDELFGGYPSFRDLPRFHRLLPWWRAVPAPLRQGLILGLRRSHDTRTRKLADLLGHARSLHELASLQRRVLPEATLQTLLVSEICVPNGLADPHHPQLSNLSHELDGSSPFRTASAWELRTYMSDVLLRDSDVFSMAHSLELRVPLVDRVLLEWLWLQPDEFIFDPHILKRALAEATADFMPESIRRRPKQGFTFPFARWMLAELRPFLDETFSPVSLTACPWLHADEVLRLWRDFIARRDARAWSRIWALAMLIAFANRRPIAA